MAHLFYARHLYFFNCYTFFFLFGCTSHRIALDIELLLPIAMVWIVTGSSIRSRPMTMFHRPMMSAIIGALLTLAVGIGMAPKAHADETTAAAATAKKLFKSMSDYVAAQKDISFDYDSILEVVTKQGQKLGLASSGSVVVNRPDKIEATRSGGFVNIAMLFDGKTLTLFGKNANLYTQADVPGNIDHLVDELRNKYRRALPAADLLLSNPYDKLMRDVVSVSDLGSGVIGGHECDSLAFRKSYVDFQIWIAQGPHPYPCRYTITSRLVADAPSYSIQIRDWKTGDEAVSGQFDFKNATNAQKVDLKDVQEKVREFPKNFVMGAMK
jgi:hypothetical protein